MAMTKAQATTANDMGDRQLQDLLQDWDRMAPVGREFGSPDYERLEELDHLAILIKPEDLIPAPVSAMHDDVRQNCLTAKNTTGSPSLLRQIHA